MQFYFEYILPMMNMFIQLSQQCDDAKVKTEFGKYQNMCKMVMERAFCEPKKVD